MEILDKIYQEDGMSQEEAKYAIIQLFKEMVPDEATNQIWDTSNPKMWGDNYTNTLRCRCDGYNFLRQQLLDRLKEMEGK